MMILGQLAVDICITILLVYKITKISTWNDKYFLDQ